MSSRDNTTTVGSTSVILLSVDGPCFDNRKWRTDGFWKFAVVGIAISAKAIDSLCRYRSYFDVSVDWARCRPILCSIKTKCTVVYGNFR